MRNSRSGRKRTPSPKICGSGRNRTMVPRRFRAIPTFSRAVAGSPLA